MKLISQIRWFIFSNMVTTIFFALLIQIATTNHVDQLSSRKLRNDRQNTYRYKPGISSPLTLQSTNSSTLLITSNEISKLQEVACFNSSPALSTEAKSRITFLETTIADVQKNQNSLKKERIEKDTDEDLYRYKRAIESPISQQRTNNSILLKMITNQIIVLKEEVAKLNSSLSSSAANEMRIASLESNYNELQKYLDTLSKMVANNENLSVELYNIISQTLKTVLFSSIVQSIRYKDFSLAEDQLKFVDNADYEKIVEAVYNRNADNIDSLLSYGGFISNIERKFKVYDALFNQMKANGHRDIWKLIRLRQAVKKEILDHAATTTAQSLFNNLVDAIQTAAIETTTNSFLNDTSWSNINSLSTTLMSDFPQSFIKNIYKEVIDGVFSTLSVQKIINGTNKIKHLESEMIILEAVYDKLKGKGALNTSSAIFLARGMILLTYRAGYHSVSSDRRTPYEDKKKKIQQLWSLVNEI